MAKRFFKRWYLVILIIFALALPLISFGADYFKLMNSDTLYEMFKTVSGRGSDVITAVEYGDIRLLNSCGAPLFIPNKTAAEWSAFLNNLPSCVTKASCGNGTCGSAENCNTCTDDCGLCCGNCLCDYGETRITCSKDCTPIGYCGDGSCSCPICDPDCAVCQDCESSYNCPEDCGVCGDGFCDGNETKATCYTDCGAPVVCPYCPPYENCNPCEALR